MWSSPAFTPQWTRDKEIRQVQQTKNKRIRQETDKDWTRIGQGQNPGRIARYGGSTLNGTPEGKGGLGVGYWGHPGAGKIHAKNDISTDQKIFTTGGIHNQHGQKILSTDLSRVLGSIVSLVITLCISSWYLIFTSLEEKVV